MLERASGTGGGEIVVRAETLWCLTRAGIDGARGGTKGWSAGAGGGGG